MRIKKRHEAPRAAVPGYPGVTKQIPLGPEDGSDEIVLRYFTVAQGEATPYHNHDFPHLVKIESGCGAAVNEAGEAMAIVGGDYVYVAPNEQHCFRNTGREPLEFICIVPMRGEAPAATDPPSGDRNP
jgi:quercetin dioxygenase-like cupin family protein